MNPAYDAARWSSYLSAQLSASAALTGLIFVAIYLAKIVVSTALVAWSAKAITTLMGVLAVTGFALVPAQSSIALGVEIFISGAVVWGIVTWTQHAASHRNPYVTWRNRLVLTAVTQIASIQFVIAGISLVFGRGGGLFWLVGGILGSFIVGLLDGWVLLIEIQRMMTLPSGRL